MKCFIKEEWWRLLLAAAWAGVTAWSVNAGRMGPAILGTVLATYFAVSAPCKHMIHHLEQEADERREQRMDALATAFMLRPIDDNMRVVGDKALLTLTSVEQGRRGYKVEYIHNDLVGADA